MAINKSIIEGNWNQFRGEVLSQWGKLTDDDIDQAKGDVTKLIGRLQELYGYERDEAEKKIQSLEGNLGKK